MSARGASTGIISYGLGLGLGLLAWLKKHNNVRHPPNDERRTTACESKLVRLVTVLHERTRIDFEADAVYERL